MENSSLPVVVVGAGIAGLTAAAVLAKAGKKVLVLEKTDQIGGRVKTDVMAGYRLDHGFQVLLTAYPEVQKLLNLKDLELHNFLPGALVHQVNGPATSLWDPIRLPAKFFATAFSSAANIKDKWLVFKLKNLLAIKTVAEVFEMPETTTLEYLRNFGFSNRVIEKFFKPFYAGIFLEPELATSCRMFAFVFKMFGEGHAALPAKGMAAIPRQLAAHLPANALVLNTPVTELAKDYALTSNGKIAAAAVIDARSNTNFDSWHATATLYFEAEKSPLSDAAIALIPNGQWVNNIAVLTDVAPTYNGGNGKTLVSVSVVKDIKKLQTSDLAQLVQAELAQLFPAAKSWNHLKTYLIPQALPQLGGLRLEIPASELRNADGVYQCGDIHLYGSLNAAMASGRRAAEAILNQ